MTSIKRFSIRRIFSNEFLSLLLSEINRIITDHSNYESIEKFNYDKQDIKANNEVMRKWMQKKEKEY